MAKEKSITELRDEKNQLVTRSKEITAAVKAEARMFTTEETGELSGIQSRLADINIEIASREAENRQTGESHAAKGKFSLRTALLELANGEGYSEGTRAVNEIGARALDGVGIARRSGHGLFIPIESRVSFTATGATGTGSDLIDTEFLNLLEPLRDRLVLAQAGATILTGLRGNIDIPSFTDNTANWENENAPAQDGGGTFVHSTMKPKRLTSVIQVSRQLLVQDTLGVENILRADLVKAITSKLEATILDAHAHAENMPDGLFTGFAGAAIDMSWASVVGLETQVDLSNALQGNTGYILHTSLYGKGKVCVKADPVTTKTPGTQGFIIENNGTMNGYPVFRTNVIASNAAIVEPATPANYGIVFGNWADLIIGQWGALDITVDPYSKADQAFVRIIVNSYWDAMPRRAVSFAKALMK
jgi:HK97 family phage major capsid protein